ncbi:TPA: hypothetical protein MIO61_04185 [Klebsiella pneumoniae subsp. pneumoniae]|nr:hypothetical protein [Klebsiella pneumoniae]HBY0472224.1 hypothetical protein [Klebsiella pneumoniae subsp. pneumoniae]HBY0593809.1 hypothetical protein [Klebsiella pneumoniae subsp. pneumoniae]HBY0600750.1 hypothetical protein [Klebsiella pneumoniae subsp. pneumoniae]HBY0644996.1 hypothetical protein [Klebsiella pneumoniae subsp. pneumoniae]
MTVIVLMWEEAAIKDDVIEYDIAFNIIYIGQGYDTESIENMGECYGDFWRKVNQNQQYTACC